MLIRPRSLFVITGIVAIDVASPVGDTYATLPFLPVLSSPPSGRYAKSVRSNAACPDDRSVSTNPAGKAGTAVAGLAVTMMVAAITDAAAMAAADSRRKRIYFVPPRDLPNPIRGNRSGSAHGSHGGW